MMLQNTPRIEPPPLVEPDWYAYRSEQKSGALRFEDLRRMADSNVLRTDDLLWRPGWEHWISARNVPSLFPDPEQLPVHSIYANRTKAMPAAGDTFGKKKEQHKLKEIAWEETKKFFLMFIYLGVIFSMFILYESVLMDKHGLDFQLHGLVIINALVLAKVMLLAEGLHLGRRFETAPPYLVILIKSALFAAAFLSFHVFEHVVIGLWKGESAWECIAQSGVGGMRGTTIISFLLTLALLPYFTFKEIEKLTGERELLALVFGRKRRPKSR